MLCIGTRGSKLALWQAEYIRSHLLRECGMKSELVIIKTAGDQFASAAIPDVGGKGIFIKEIEDALLERRVDLAVHSMKDVPTETPRGLSFPAIIKREDPRDCLVSRSGAVLAELPAGARIGTSSLRRQAQLRYIRGDLQIVNLRGNVDTRLRKLDAGEVDAIMLARAGLDRLGLSGRITETLAPEVMLSAVGQGALALESREDDVRVLEALARFDDAETRTAVTAERALLAELEGGCQVPLGAWARIEDGTLHMDARVLAADGSECIERHASDSLADAEEIGRKLARELLDAGADRLLRLAGRSVGGH
ncbi:MAG TPA: hydroxymethylbilane synthase [Candidatus Acidoferrales bacterium]|nr:hydroxymethylbilane synthase [Candidatus Acidoferrales bacterium]